MEELNKLKKKNRERWPKKKKKRGEKNNLLEQRTQQNKKHWIGKNVQAYQLKKKSTLASINVTIPTTLNTDSMETLFCCEGPFEILR